MAGKTLTNGEKHKDEKFLVGQGVMRVKVGQRGKEDEIVELQRWGVFNIQYLVYSSQTDVQAKTRSSHQPQVSPAVNG